MWIVTAEFFQNQEFKGNDSEEDLLQKQSNFAPSRGRDRDLDNQIDVLNNLKSWRNGEKI